MIVGDVEEGDAAFVLQAAHQVEDRQADRHVEHRGRLVGDDQLGADRERPGKVDALALAARELVRIFADGLLGIELDLGLRMRRTASSVSPSACPWSLSGRARWWRTVWVGLRAENGILEDHLHGARHRPARLSAVDGRRCPSPRKRMLPGGQPERAGRSRGRRWSSRSPIRRPAPAPCPPPGETRRRGWRRSPCGRRRSGRRERSWSRRSSSRSGRRAHVAASAGHDRHRVEPRHRLPELPRIGVLRRSTMSLAVGDLDQPAVEHDADAVGELGHQREVVGDEQDGEAEPRLEVEHLLQDLALHDDVERGRRLVHDDQLRIERQRDGEDHALAHAAGELMRIVVEPAPPGCRPARGAPRRAPARCARSAPVWRAITSRNCSKIGDHRVQRIHRTLEDHRHGAPAPGRKPRLIEGEDVLAVDQDPSVDDVAPAGGCSRISAKATVLLPQPDSPASPTISPRADIEVEIVDRGEGAGRRQVVDPEVAHLDEVRRHLSASGARRRRSAARRPDDAPDGRQRPDARIGDLVDAEIDQRQADADDRDGGAGCEDLPPGADGDRRGGLGVVEHGAPRHRQRIAEAEELERRLGDDGVDDAADEIEADDRQEIGDDLDQRSSATPARRASRDAWMNSRCRSDRVCARVTRGPQPHEVKPMMMAITSGTRLADEGGEHEQERQLRNDETMLVRKLSTSSTQPPK